MKKANNQKSKDITVGLILKWTTSGLGVIFICYVLTILWTLNAHHFKVVDPEDPRFKAEDFRFDDYIFNREVSLGQGKGAFKKGMSMSEVDSILVDKNRTDKEKNKALLGYDAIPPKASVCYTYNYTPWWEAPVSIAVLQLDGFRRFIHVCFDEEKKIVYVY